MRSKKKTPINNTFVWFSLTLWANSTLTNDTQVHISKGRQITGELRLKQGQLTAFADEVIFFGE